MSEMVRRAAVTIARSTGDVDEDDAVPIARAALRDALDPEDEKLVELVGEAYRNGMRDFLDSLKGDSIGAINRAMQDTGARAAIAALKAAAQGGSVE